MPLIEGQFEPLDLPRKHARVLLDSSKAWRYRCLHGGRNGAKDWSVTAVLIERAVRQLVRVLFTREIQKTIKDSVHQLLSDTIKRLGYSDYFTINETNIKGNNGSNFMFTGLRDLNADNLKSIEGVDVAVVGEAQNLTKKSNEILDPTIRKPGSEIWYIFNDQSEYDFVYQFCVDDPPDNLIGDRVSYLDLPKEWVSQVIRDQAERMKKTNLKRYEHIWLGMPGGGGQFFPEFGDHLREQPYDIQPHLCNLYGSIDYGDGQGENAGATSFGLWHIDKDGRPHRLFTYYKRHQDATTYSREIVAAVQSFPHTQGVMPKKTFADPSMFIKRQRLDDNDATASKSVADIFKQHGLPLAPANNDRVNGWRVMRDHYGLDETGTPKSFYWDGYNDEYEEYIPTLIGKEKNPDDCVKGGEDHIGDETRYLMVQAMGLKSGAIVGKRAKARNVKKTIQKLNKLSQDSPTGAA